MTHIPYIFITQFHEIYYSRVEVDPRTMTPHAIDNIIGE